MTQMTIEDKMTHINKVLDEYESSVGLPAHICPGEEAEVSGYINKSRDALEKLQTRDCVDIATRIMSFVFYWQRCVNREKARVTWCNGALNFAVAKHYGDFSSYMKHEVRVAALAQSDEYVCKLFQVITKANQRIDRMDGLMHHARIIADIYRDNARAMRNEQYR